MHWNLSSLDEFSGTAAPSGGAKSQARWSSLSVILAASKRMLNGRKGFKQSSRAVLFATTTPQALLLLQLVSFTAASSPYPGLPIGVPVPPRPGYGRGYVLVKLKVHKGLSQQR